MRYERSVKLMLIVSDWFTTTNEKEDVAINYFLEKI